MPPDLDEEGGLTVSLWLAARLDDRRGGAVPGAP
jgi:hypothetical protein